MNGLIKTIDNRKIKYLLETHSKFDLGLLNFESANLDSFQMSTTTNSTYDCISHLYREHS